MVHNCSCGGRMKRTDIVAVRNTRSKNPPYFYQDTDSEKANFRCDNCGKVATQRKRQPSKVVTVTVELFKAYTGETLYNAQITTPTLRVGFTASSLWAAIGNVIKNYTRITGLRA